MHKGKPKTSLGFVITCAQGILAIFHKRRINQYEQTVWQLRRERHDLRQEVTKLEVRQELAKESGVAVSNQLPQLKT